MKTTKRMRTAMLAVVAMLVVGVVAVLACGPAAAPEQQSGGAGDVSESVSALATEAPFVLPQSGDGERDDQQDDTGDEPTPTATPYPDDCKKKHNLRTEVWEIVCPPAGSRKIEHNLRRHYNDHMEEKATRQARGESMEVFERQVIIEVSTHDAVDAVVEYLEARTDNWVSGYKDPGAGGLVTGLLSIELLPALAEMEDVLRVDQEFMPSPGSLMRQSNPLPTMTAVERVRADQWHDAGVTGSGVGVAVIDVDFRNFRTRIADPAVVNADPNQPDSPFGLSSHLKAVSSGGTSAPLGRHGLACGVALLIVPGVAQFRPETSPDVLVTMRQLCADAKIDAAECRLWKSRVTKLDEGERRLGWSFWSGLGGSRDVGRPSAARYWKWVICRSLPFSRLGRLGCRSASRSGSSGRLRPWRRSLR